LSVSKKVFFTSLGLLCVWGCATVKPHLPLVLAREALASAKEVDAGRYSPGYYFKAEEAFRAAMTLYNEKSYPAAIEKFDQARSFAEKAELSARLQRQKAGDEAL
jgi:hypothetical protein